MTGPCFVVTNVLAYADDAADPRKRAIARDLLRNAVSSGLGRISTQVLTEFFSVAIRKLGLEPAQVRRRIQIYASLPVFRPAVADLLAAVDLHRLHQLSIWDALIVRSAQATGSLVLLTEDLQHGQQYDGLEVVNPFVE